MAELGLCSRREADKFIVEGHVKVNGHIVRELGLQVEATDQIELTGKALHQQANLLTVALYKPVGFVSAQPENNYKASWELLTKENCRNPQQPFDARNEPNLAVIGRLDIDSRGLLIFTQDGRLAKAVIGENSRIEKEYHVLFRDPVPESALRKLRSGLTLDGIQLRPATIERLGDRQEREKQLKFILTEGRKRQIRRMCELVDLRVHGLIRVRIGHLQLGLTPLSDLREGEWQTIAPEDILGKA